MARKRWHFSSVKTLGTRRERWWPPVAWMAGKIDQAVNGWRIQGAQVTIRTPWRIVSILRTDRVTLVEQNWRPEIPDVTFAWKASKVNTFTLPAVLKGCAFVLRFAEPIPHTQVHTFKATLLPDELLAKGEKDFYLQDVTQPQRFCGICLQCKSVMMKAAELAEWICTNPQCEVSGIIQHVEPKRGIVEVLTFQEFVKERHGGLDYVDGCVVVMDRRYSDETLRQTYKLCGVVAEIQRMKLMDCTF